jgi:hypothetical protein
MKWYCCHGRGPLGISGRTSSSYLGALGLSAQDWKQGSSLPWRWSMAAGDEV